MRIVVFLIALTYGLVYPYTYAKESECPNVDIVTSTEGFRCYGCVKFMPEFSYIYWLGKNTKTNEDAKFIEQLGDGINEEETVSTTRDGITHKSKVLHVTDIDKFAHHMFTCVFVTLEGASKKNIWLK
ncbi:soluble il-18 binding protein [Skunkpox virus]|uniref:Soluble il-18 binding protein n=1 Tax=Skunkpox virus TaxID=160796 RepID=A0A1C9KBG0_9POXV|nr:soluble il-18 binding protein [Skunkpox virus]AOP31494.1 soluble il-18 binding protein [Skunkpox virus]